MSVDPSHVRGGHSHEPGHQLRVECQESLSGTHCRRKRADQHLALFSSAFMMASFARSTNSYTGSSKHICSEIGHVPQPPKLSRRTSLTKSKKNWHLPSDHPDWWESESWILRVLQTVEQKVELAQCVFDHRTWHLPKYLLKDCGSILHHLLGNRLL